MDAKKKFVTRFVNFLNTTAGRDKSARFFQYSSKFFKAWIKTLSEINITKEKADSLVKKLEILGAQTSNCRKILRFFRQISILKKISELINLYEKNKGKDLEKTGNLNYVLSKIIADLSLCLFFFFDHILWITKLLLDNDKKEADNSNKRVNECIVDILRSLIDLPVCVSFMKEGTFSDGYVGVLGSITSLIGCYQNFK